MVYQKHIFICTHKRDHKKSCGNKDEGAELVVLFKKAIKEKKLKIEMRAQQAGCFDLCDHGPLVAIYPEGVFYKDVKPKDVIEIVESHLIKNEIVKRLVYKPPVK